MKHYHIKALGILLLLLFIASFTVACGGASESGETAELITFSEPPGIYQSRFNLGVSCSDSSLTLRYTVDSSVPTIESDEVGEEGIKINYRGGGGDDPSSVNIIRVAAFDVDNNRVGDVLTGTYILADLPEVRYSTMIVSIVSEPDDLYGYERGILVAGKIRDDFNRQKPASWTNESLKDANFFRSGIEWERPAHVEFYTASGELMLSQNVGVRVSGGWNRNNAHKSLRLFARYEYDDTNVMSFDAYPGLTSTTGIPVGDHKTLILRTGSNNLGNTTIQTQFLMSLAEETGLDVMNYRPVCVYVNGKYYGYMAMIEDYSTTYFETNYNIPSDFVTCINGAGYIDGRTREWQLDSGISSELSEYKKMMDYIINLDMREEKYYKRASEMLDLDNYIRYMCFEGYIANSDWPQNNVRLWRYHGGIGKEGYDERGYDPDNEDYGFDGRWRFLLKDLDLSGGYGDNVATSIFSRLNSDDGSLRLNAMFKSLFRNADFKNRVYCFLCDLLSTTMKPENVTAHIGLVEAAALTEMRYYTGSWNASGGNNEKWHNHLRTPVNFFRTRYDNVYAELADKYDSPWGELKVETEGEGILNIGTLELSENTTLGYLVGLKIPVTATAAKGWRLVSLEVGGTKLASGEKFMMRSKQLTLKAVFEPDTEAVQIERTLVINELKYNHSRLSGEPDRVELYNAGDEPIYLKGWTLVKEGLRADGSEDRDEWSFPAVTVGVGEYLTVACDRKGTSQWVEGHHASFGIAIGDRLTVIDRTGAVIDSAELVECSNFATLARDLDAVSAKDEWYFEPYKTFGSENVRASGYRLADVIDERAFGTFIHKGRFFDDLAEPTSGGGYSISARSLKEAFGSDQLDRVKKKLGDKSSYDLDDALSVLGYRRWEIPDLGSNVIFKQ